jgi:hypothetical protein
MQLGRPHGVRGAAASWVCGVAADAEGEVECAPNGGLWLAAGGVGAGEDAGWLGAGRRGIVVLVKDEAATLGADEVAGGGVGSRSKADLAGSGAEGAGVPC